MRLRRKKYCGAGIGDALSHLFLKRLKWSGFSWSLDKVVVLCSIESRD